LVDVVQLEVCLLGRRAGSDNYLAGRNTLLDGFIYLLRLSEVGEVGAECSFPIVDERLAESFEGESFKLTGLRSFM
jgi:hypothetical protein